MGTLVRSVLSQDSTKRIAGDDVEMNTAEARYEMHRNYYYHGKKTHTLIIASICLQIFQ